MLDSSRIAVTTLGVPRTTVTDAAGFGGAGFEQRPRTAPRPTAISTSMPNITAPSGFRHPAADGCGVGVSPCVGVLGGGP